MQQGISKRRAAAPGPKAEAPSCEHGPVVVLEPDHVAAGALQTRLAACGFDWIALVHDVADARRFLAAAPARLVMLSLDRGPSEVLVMAHALDAAGVPVILTSASGGMPALAGAQGAVAVIARGCPGDVLAAALAAELDRKRR